MAKSGWKQWTEAEARRALEELGRTRESELAFTRRRGISRQRLRYWRQRLGHVAAKPAFVALTIPTPVGAAPTIEIRVGEVLLRIREGLDVEHVARLVRALARADGC